MQTISVLVPTLAVANRAAPIRRALASIRNQRGVRAVPIVVVNGPDRDPALVRELKADATLRVLELPEASIPAAFAAGRAAVDTATFSALDDDDVLLPDALQGRSAALEQTPHLEAVVSNGFRRDARGDTVHVTDTEAVRRRPLEALLRANWLLPGSWLCRTEALPPSFFAAMPRYLECTYLAVRLASGGRMLFLDEPTVAWYTDNPESASKSPGFQLGEVAGLREILKLSLPSDFRAGMERKVAEAAHSLASRRLSEGKRTEAWRWHLASLRERGGLRYLFYTRHLLLPRKRAG